MRLATVRTPEGTRAVRVDGDRAFEIEPARQDVGAVLAAGGEPVAGSRGSALDEIDLAPVVTHPAKIICLGLNYKSHIEEMQGELPAHPTLFAKFATALCGARDPIVIPEASNAVDWEAELAFVIGASVRNAGDVEANEAIAGYTVLNDVSMRDWQWRTQQWLQ